MICTVNAYEKWHVTMPDDAGSSGDIPIPIKSYEVSLISIVQIINFIYNWLNFFEDHCDIRIVI